MIHGSDSQGKQDTPEGKDNATEDCSYCIGHFRPLVSVCSVDDVAIVCVQCNIQPRVYTKFLHGVL